MSYTVAPHLEWGLRSTAVASTTVAGWPGLAVGLVRGTVALPFVFHSLNRLRPLRTNVGAGFVNQQLIKSRWLVIVLSAGGHCN